MEPSVKRVIEKLSKPKVKLTNKEINLGALDAAPFQKRYYAIEDEELAIGKRIDKLEASLKKEIEAFKKNQKLKTQVGIDASNAEDQLKRVRKMMESNGVDSSGLSQQEEDLNDIFQMAQRDFGYNLVFKT